MHHLCTGFFLLIVFTGITLGADIPIPNEQLHIYKKGVTTWVEMRDAHVVKQKFDYSCGSAALETLMKYYFEDDVPEKTIIDSAVADLKPVEVADRVLNGLSLLDLQKAAQKLGYQAEGVKLSIEVLPELEGPILIHVIHDGYRHFTVLRGIRQDRVFLADPSQGNIRIPIREFAEEWTGACLILGKKDFGLPMIYPLAIRDSEAFRWNTQIIRRFIYK
jgi:predicted double-glycine peptidase